MNEIDQQRIVDWICDASAILDRRAAATSPSEQGLQRGFTALHRHLNVTPASCARQTAWPLHEEEPITAADLRHIIQALDMCLAILRRHERSLSTAQRRIYVLVRATRRHAAEETVTRSRSTWFTHVPAALFPADASFAK